MMTDNFVKLSYQDYKAVERVLTELEEDAREYPDCPFEDDERAVLQKVRRIVSLMDKKRLEEDRRQKAEYSSRVESLRQQYQRRGVIRPAAEVQLVEYVG